MALSKNTIRRIINEESKRLMRESKEETGLEEALSMYHQLFESVNPTWRVILEGDEVDSMNEDDVPGEGFINRAYRGGGGAGDGERPRQDDDEREEREPTRDEPRSVVRDVDQDDPEPRDTRMSRRNRDRVSAPREKIDMEEAEKTLMAKFRDSEMVDLGLGLLGSLGGWVAAQVTAGTMGLGAPIAYTIAAVPDLINSARYALRGQRLEAVIAFLSALPIIGEVLGPARISLRLFGTFSETMKIMAGIKHIRNIITAAKVAREVKPYSEMLVDFCKKEMPNFDAESVARDADILVNGSDEELEEFLRSDGYEFDAEEYRKFVMKKQASDSEGEKDQNPAPVSEGRTLNIIMETSKKNRRARHRN